MQGNKTEIPGKSMLGQRRMTAKTIRGRRRKGLFEGGEENPHFMHFHPGPEKELAREEDDSNARKKLEEDIRLRLGATQEEQELEEPAGMQATTGSKWSPGKSFGADNCDQEELRAEPTKRRGGTDKRLRRAAKFKGRLLGGSGLQLGLLIFILQLICDNNSKHLSSDGPYLFRLAHAQQAVVNLSSSSSMEDHQTSSPDGPQHHQQAATRFLVEPRDTYALNGQQLAQLRCATLSNGEQRHLSWFRSSHLIVSNRLAYIKKYSVRLEQMSPSDFWASSMSNSSSFEDELDSTARGREELEEEQRRQESLNNNNNNLGNQDQIVTSYNLQIFNVTLHADDEYHCKDGKTASRAARLVVLQPPSRVELTASSVESEDGSASSSSNNDNNTNNNVRPTSNGNVSDAAAGEDVVASGAAAADDDDDDDHQAIRIVVRQNSRLSLECRAHEAKPQAELIWLDADRRPVNRSQLGGLHSSRPAAAAAAAAYFGKPRKPTVGSEANLEQIEDYSNVGPEDPQLATLTSVYSFQVTREHHNQRISCESRHKAYELIDRMLLAAPNQDDQQQQPSYFTKYKSLVRRRSVRLDVEFEPVIDLTKDDLTPTEGKPLLLTCAAYGRPNVLTYEWFIDNVPILEQPIGAPGSAQALNNLGRQLHIPKLTRQLHLREIKCLVKNRLGSSSAVIRLAIKYSPAFVTHLLPPSLQPASAADVDVAELSAADNNNNNEPTSSSSTAPNSSPLQQLELASIQQQRIGHQLAEAVQAGSDVTLRCDFDSNPRPHKIEWFRIKTNWDLMSDVPSELANEYIAHGYLPAAFQKENALRVRPNLRLRDEAGSLKPSKRHIAAVSNLEANSLRLAGQHQVSLASRIDYAQMSERILAELDHLEDSRRRRELELVQMQNQQSSNKSSLLMADEAASSPGLLSALQPIEADQPIQTQPRIYEPLGFELLHQQQQSLNAPKARKTDQNDVEEGSSAASPTLHLFNAMFADHYYYYSNNQANNNSKQQQLQWRHAQLTSSSVSLRQVNEDDVGQYICLAHGQQSAEPQQQQQRRFARALHLVLKKTPRIVSVAKQYALPDERQLRLECLVQLNGLANNGQPTSGGGTNRTEFHWFRAEPGQPNSFKPIDLKRKSSQGSSHYSLREERSPDLLFARSVLQIDWPESSDFGQYNCTVINALGRDSIRIDLLPRTGLGFNSNELKMLAFGLAIFSGLVILLLVVACRRLDRGAMAKTAAVVLAANKRRRRRHQRQSHLSGHNNNNSNKNLSAAKEPNACCSGGSSSGDDTASSTATARGASAGRQPELPPALHALHCEATLSGPRLLTSIGSVYQASGEQLQMSTPPRRPESTLSFSPQLTSHFDQQQQQQVGSFVAGQPMRCSLRYTSSAAASAATTGGHPQRGPSRFAAIHESLEQKLQFCPTQQPHPSAGSIDVDTTKSSAGLLGKLWGKFQGATETMQQQQQQVHERPSISSPTGFRCSTGGSLSVLTGSQDSSRISRESGTQRQQFNGDHTHLDSSRLGPVSSSSGRSTASSSSRMSSSTMAQTAAAYTSNQLQNWQQPPPAPPSLDALYAADQQHQHQQQQQLYENYCQQSSSHQMDTNQCNAGALGSNGAEADGEHYQMPVTSLMSEQYLAQMAAQQQQRQQQVSQQTSTCYATICGQAPAAAKQVATVLVPTSDGGDAYFESNYGTLLSKSSAYKTLGYTTANAYNSNANNIHSPPSASNALLLVQQQQQHHHHHQLGSNGTSASSPSSTSTASSSSSSSSSSAAAALSHPAKTAASQVGQQNSTSPNSLTTHASGGYATTVAQNCQPTTTTLNLSPVDDANFQHHPRGINHQATGADIIDDHHHHRYQHGRLQQELEESLKASCGGDQSPAYSQANQLDHYHQPMIAMSGIPESSSPQYSNKSAAAGQHHLLSQQHESIATHV